MPFLQKIIDGLAYGIGLTVAWYTVGAVLDFLARSVP